MAYDYGPDKKGILEAIKMFKRVMTTPSSSLNKYVGFDIPDRLSKTSLLGHLTKSLVNQKSRDDLRYLGFLGAYSGDFSLDNLAQAARGVHPNYEGGDYVEGADYSFKYGANARSRFLETGLDMGVIKDTTGIESGFRRLLSNPAQADSAFYTGQTVARGINPELPRIPQEVRNMALPHPSMMGYGAHNPETGYYDPKRVTYDPRPGVDKAALLAMLVKNKLR